VIKGSLCVNGLTISTGDAVLMSGESQITLDQGQNAEVLVFDLCA
jgi:redox-sensitive bicupin YhaK (pirin superfamily)